MLPEKNKGDGFAHINALILMASCVWSCQEMKDGMSLEIPRVEDMILHTRAGASSDGLLVKFAVVPTFYTNYVTGQWELADLVTTRSVQIGDQKIEVYIDFKADNTFKLWQMLGTAYEVSIVDDVLHMKETNIPSGL